MKCGAQLPDEAQFCMKCGSKTNADQGVKMSDVVASRSEIEQSADGSIAEMSDVIAQKSRIHQSSSGTGSGTMKDVHGDRSQFGQASVGSIHIGDKMRFCPICDNTISTENKSVVCFKCSKKFCETCEGYFRTERKLGERPLCEMCFDVVIPTPQKQQSGATTSSVNLYSTRLDEVLAIYNSIADEGLQSTSTARKYRQIRPRHWPGGIHYEFLAYPNKMGVEIHIEHDQVLFLSDTIRNLESVVRMDFSDLDISWDQKWAKKRGRLKLIFGEKASSKEIAHAMKKLIKITYDSINKKVEESS